MKKIVLVACMLSIIYNVNAQESTPPNKQVTFGVKAGINFANVSGNDVDYFLDDNEQSGNARIGLVLGGLVAYTVSEKFAVQGELAYAQKGYYKKYSEDDYSLTIKLDYLNLPILAKYYIAERFSIEAGPEIDFLMSAKFFEKELDDDKDTYTDDIKEDFKSTDFGFNLGFGYQLKNGFGVNARYTLGLSNILEYDDADLKNKGFQLGVFYTF